MKYIVLFIFLSSLSLGYASEKTPKLTFVTKRNNQMKYLFFTLVFFLASSALFAQRYVILVKDEAGVALPYVHAVAKPSGVTALTNANGALIFDHEDFTDEDILVFDSMFYEKLEIPVRELMMLKEVSLKSNTFTLMGVTVKPLELEKIVAKMAAFFSVHYARDYAAKVTRFRTVECNDKYREFSGYQGIFASTDFLQYPYPQNTLQDRNWMGRLAPLAIMRSDPLLPGSDELLEKVTTRTSDNRWSKSALAIEYENHDFNSSAPATLTAKRSLELYSPLNPRQIKNFSYELQSVYNCGNEKIYVIKFQNKVSTYPKRTKIFGQGFIYYNSTNELVERIVMENHQDQFVGAPSFPNWKKMSELLPSATQHKIEVQYAFHEGCIYTKKVSLTVNWVDPKVDENFFRFIKQSRRNPIKNRLREYICYEFSDVVLLNNILKARVQNLILARPGFLANFFIPTPFEKEKWENVPMPCIDVHRLLQDLHVNGKTLNEQAEKNGLDHPYFGSEDKSQTVVFASFSADSPGVSSLKSVNDVSSYHFRIRNELYPLLYSQIF